MNVVMELAKHFGDGEDEAVSEEMTKKMLDSAPIRQIKMFAQLSDAEIDSVIARLNDIYKGQK